MKIASPLSIATIAAVVLAGAIGFTIYAEAQNAQHSAQSKGGWSGQRSGSRQGRGPWGQMMTVAVATVTTLDIPTYINAVGTVTARNTATVRARVSGQLEKVLFKEGSEVKAGEVLAVIDPRPYQAALDQQLAQLQRDQAQLDNAKHDLERYQGLVEQKVISQQQVDTQVALVHQYDGVVAMDRAQVESARLNLSYTSITAPLNGRLGLRQVDPGNLVSSSDANGIVVMTQIKPINVIFAVPADQAMPVIKLLNGGAKLPVDALDRDGKTSIATGFLLTADNQIDPATGTIKLKAEFANNDRALFPNQFVNVRLQSSLSKGANVVPSAAIQQDGTETFVYVVKPDTSVSRRKVSISSANTGGNAIVTAGLNAGEQVVVDGIDKLHDGLKVKISSVAAAQAAASGNVPQGEHKQWAGQGTGQHKWQHKQQAAQ